MRSIHWCFTINNYTYDDLLSLMDIPAKYMIIGFEEGEQGTPHIQGYVSLHNQMTRDILSEYIPRGYLVVSKGNAQQNYEYCSKAGDFYEFGDIPTPGRAKWEKIEEAMKNPREDPHTYTQYRKVYKEIMAKEKEDHERRIVLIPNEDRYRVAEKCTLTVYFANGYSFDCMDTYDGEEVVILDDQHPTWIDQWVRGFPPKIKRGYELIKIDPHVVYCTYSSEREKNKLEVKYQDYILF